jgi:hypothetical protein
MEDIPLVVFEWLEVLIHATEFPVLCVKLFVLAG